MRCSTGCALKYLIKLLAASIIIILISNIGFRSRTDTHTNDTIVTTPTPEEELLYYIKNISYWKDRNDSEIINPHPFKYLHIPSNTCKLNGAASDPFLLIVVKSFVSNIGNREAIRTTWGKILYPSVKIVFLLGQLDFMNSYIIIERERYKDVIQEDFIDAYQNNTVKTIMGFSWAVTNCKETPYIFFVDDDYLVNIPNILSYLRSHRKQGKRGLYTGYLWEKAYPKRSNSSKWYVSVQDYPCTIWPNYVGGGSVLVSMDVAFNMTTAFPYIKPIFIDDVYLGIVAASLGIKATMEGKFCPDYHPDKINKLFSTHGVHSSNVLIQDWARVKRKLNLNYT